MCVYYINAFLFVFSMYLVNPIFFIYIFILFIKKLFFLYKHTHILNTFTYHSRGK